MACRERCYSDGTSTCWKHLRLKSVSRAALFDLELLWYFVVILTPHNSPLKGKRLVWSTKCLDILYCPTVFRDFPFCSCHFLLHLFNASPVPFPWQPFPYLSHGTFCRYFWLLSFLVMIPDYFCRFLSWIPKIYLGSKESCHFPASHIGAVSASIILPLSSSHACPIETTIKNHPIIPSYHHLSSHDYSPPHFQMRICDSMAAALMQRCGLDACIVGADRVVANGAPRDWEDGGEYFGWGVKFIYMLIYLWNMAIFHSHVSCNFQNLGYAPPPRNYG